MIVKKFSSKKDFDSFLSSLRFSTKIDKSGYLVLERVLDSGEIEALILKGEAKKNQIVNVSSFKFGDKFKKND